GAHGRERLVARRVEEGDRAAVVADLVGADVLRDAAGLALDDVRLADGVEQRRLAVVDVAHDRDDRRALDEVLGGVLESRLVVGRVVGVDDLDLLLERLGEHADGLVGQRLRERHHLAHHHQLLDDLRHGHAEVLGDVLDGRARVDPDDVGAERRLLVQRRGCLGEDVAAPASATARALLGPGRSAAGTTGPAGAAGPPARGLRVDDDATGAAAGGALVTQAAAVRAPARLRGLGLGLVARRALLGLRRRDDLGPGAGGGRALGRRDDARAGAAAPALRAVLARSGGRVGLGLRRALLRAGSGGRRRRGGLALRLRRGGRLGLGGLRRGRLRLSGRGRRLLLGRGRLRLLGGRGRGGRG